MIVKAKIYTEHEFFKTISFEIKELYTTSFDAASFTIPETYERIKKKTSIRFLIYFLVIISIQTFQKEYFQRHVFL